MQQGRNSDARKSDGRSSKASRIPTQSNHQLNQDQVQGITGSGRTEGARPGPKPEDHREQMKVARPGPKPRDHGETDAGKLDPDQVQGITGRQAGSAGSTRTKASGSLGAHRQKVQHRRRQGKDRIKLHIVRPKLVRYACYVWGFYLRTETTAKP